MLAEIYIKALLVDEELADQNVMHVTVRRTSQHHSAR
jgi:hypothetical protein